MRSCKPQTVAVLLQICRGSVMRSKLFTNFFAEKEIVCKVALILCFDFQLTFLFMFFDPVITGYTTLRQLSRI